MRAERVVSLAFILGVWATPAAADDAAATAVDVEFLEYLGGLVRDGERWIDPLDLQHGDGDETEFAERARDASIEAVEQERAQ